MGKEWVKELENKYEEKILKGFEISCPGCEYMNKFKEHVGVYFREFYELLKGKCPICGNEVKLVVNKKENSIIAICKNGHEFLLKGLKNLEEEFLKDKEWSWIYIVPKCPRCGKGCEVFLNWRKEN